VHVVLRMQMVGDDIAGDPGTYDRNLHVDPSINSLSCSSAPWAGDVRLSRPKGVVTAANTTS
jgi:hypothetical protein